MIHVAESDDTAVYVCNVMLLIVVTSRTVTSRGVVSPGLRGVSVGEALPAAVHVPQEEPQEEGDGFPQRLPHRQVLQRAVELHRPASAVHSRE